MLKKIVNLFPSDVLVKLYKLLPFSRLKNWLVYKSQDRFLVSVLGVITNEAGQLLLLKHTYRDEPWGIPGGWMELEKPEEGLAREIQEETGFIVEITGISQALFNTKPTRVDLIFKGKIVGGTFKPCTEISDFMYCDVDNWPIGLPEVQKELIKSQL